MKNYKLDENGRLSQEDVKRFKILRNKEYDKIVGGTGAGKSTIINILNGITSADSKKSVWGPKVLDFAYGLVEMQEEIQRVEQERAAKLEQERAAEKLEKANR